MNYYVNISSDTAADWNPFEPTALGALQEALTWIQQPLHSSASYLTYSPTRYNKLTAMLRRAVQIEAERQLKHEREGVE